MTEEWFAYDPVDGASFFATEAEARKQAEDWLDEERDNAGEGWSEDVEGICWGRVCGGVVQTKNEPAPEGSDFDYIADYALRDAPAEVARVTWPTVDQIDELVNAVNKASGTQWEPSDAMRLIGALAPASTDDSAWACNARRMAAERGLIADTAARVTPAVEMRGVVTVVANGAMRILVDDGGDGFWMRPAVPNCNSGDAVILDVRKG